MHSTGNKIFVNNQSNESGYLTLYNSTGKVLLKYKMLANKMATYRTHLRSGNYTGLVSAKLKNESTKIIVN